MEELETIRQVLARRDGLAENDIDNLLASARTSIEEGDDPEEVLAELFGLEPDYIFDTELGLF